MKRHHIWGARADLDGAALLIVLAFVVLLTGVIVAFLTRTTTERQASSGSANQAKADIIARSGLAFVVSQLKQEIEAGSAKSTLGGATLYTPNAAANIVPIKSGVPAGAPFANMIRRSVHQADFTAVLNDPSRASAVNSETNASLDGRSVSKARWNAHYLITKAAPGNDASDPDNAFISPDWVIVSRDGIAVKTDTDVSAMRDSSNAGFALGRFAYIIYDEGGLLDVNVAGYPTDPGQAGTSVATNAPVGGKGSPALADLAPLFSSGTIAEQRTAINKIIGWRNYATAQPGGSFPNFTFTLASGSTWYNNVVANNTSGFIKVSSTNATGPTDQALSSRQELIKLRRSLGISVNVLQYLGTFTREKNVPTWRSGTAAINKRSDIANIGLVKPNPAAGQVGPIKAFFGLEWIAGTPGTAGPPTTATIPGHWRYVGQGAALQTSIPPFTTDPDFFQLLNYAMNSTNADDPAHIRTTLSVGAALIDQYDDDTAADPLTGITTTMIEYGGGWAFGLENTDPGRPAASPSPFPTPGGMSPTPPPAVTGYTMLNRPFRNVGEFGYAFRASAVPTPTPAAPKTLDFYTAASTDGPILDLFATSTVPIRAGVVNLNTRQDLVLRALLSFATATQPSTAITSARRNSTATGLVTATTAPNPANGRQDLARLAQLSGITGGEEVQEVVARALADMCQTRTWNLMIDVICQSGRYPPTATSLPQFVVEGEKRYWLHVAIDRFTGEVIDRQLEAVNE